MIRFREVQQFRQPWIWIVLLAGLAVLVYGLYQQLVFGPPSGNKPPPSDLSLVLTSVACLLFLTWFFLLKLVTEVDDREIRTQFVWMWRVKHIPFETVREAKAVTYRPLLEYGGWGIRWGASGWAYNVSGNRGVRIRYMDGGSFLIGSQRAEELELAIRSKMGVTG